MRPRVGQLLSAQKEVQRMEEGEWMKVDGSERGREWKAAERQNGKTNEEEKWREKNWRKDEREERKGLKAEEWVFYSFCQGRTRPGG